MAMTLEFEILGAVSIRRNVVGIEANLGVLALNLIPFVFLLSRGGGGARDIAGGQSTDFD